MADGNDPLLNDEQRRAIEYNNGPLLIVAGAGTGKTTVITEKIKNLIQQKNVKPDHILALTFTEKAAREMEERVDKTMPYGYFQMWISTFHSFADQLLREEGSHIGLNPSYKLLTQAQTIMFLRNRLFLFNLKYFRPLGNPNKFLDALLQHFSRLRDEDISPEEYIAWTQKLKPSEEMSDEEIEKFIELANAYKTYQDIKIKEGFFDFADLIYYLLQLLRKRPSLLEKYQKQFTHVLVDEFQDTNIAQYQLIKLLCPPSVNPHLTIVGDDSQAIYKFRGASVSNILNFMSDYKGAEQITLNKNYRSNQSVLDASYKLIQSNNPDTLESKLGISKQLVASKTKNKKMGEAVTFNLFEQGEEEAEFAANEIFLLKQKEQYLFSDFAILVRANSHADPFISALSRRGIPYRFLGPGMLFRQPEVKDLIAYLKLLYNIEDSVAFYRVLSMDLFEMDKKDISLLLAFAKKTSLGLFQATEIVCSFSTPEWFQEEYETYRRYLPFISPQTRQIIKTIVTMIKRHLALLKKDSAGQILFYFLEDTGYLKKLGSYKTAKDEKVAMNISKFFNKLKSFESEHDEASVFEVVDFIDMSMELGESPIVAETDVADYDAVNILTLHAAKGLEFPIVFLINLSHGRFPTYEKREPIPIPQELIKELLPEGDFHLQEERRLFYVGLTRAKDKAYLSASMYYAEGKRERKISPFVIETLGEEQVAKLKLIKKEEKTQLSIFDFKKNEEPIIKERLPLSNFSYTQLESYRTCPLQYKYQYLLKIPTTPNSAASFGDTIHRTLQQFYQEYMNDNNVDEKRLIEIYTSLWAPVGYSSQAHQQKMKKEGELLLQKYFKTLHSKHISVKALEKLFKIRMNEDIFLTGKIDRVDHTAQGGIEIIDYKTGKQPPEKEVQKSLQLSIYALAAMDKGLYQQELSKVTLTFYYLQTMEKVSIQRTPEDIALVTQEVEKTVAEIRKSNFEPRVGPWCDFCAFRLICEAWQ